MTAVDRMRSDGGHGVERQEEAVEGMCICGHYKNEHYNRPPIGCAFGDCDCSKYTAKHPEHAMVFGSFKEWWLSDNLLKALNIRKDDHAKTWNAALDLAAEIADKHHCSGIAAKIRERKEK